MKKKLARFFSYLLGLIVIVALAFGLSYFNKRSLAHVYFDRYLNKKETKTDNIGSTTTDNTVAKSTFDDKSFTKLFKTNGFSGVATAYNGKNYVNAVSGFANQQNKTSIDQKTQFQLSSMQNAITTLLILRLVDQKVLKLDDPLSNYYQTINGSYQITIRDLLNQTSGLSINSQSTGDMATYSTAEWLAANVVFTPEQKGTEKFSSANSLLLANIINIATNDSYDKYFARVAGNSAKLANTSFGEPANNATYYTKNDNGTYAPIDNLTLSGFGYNPYQSKAIYTTSADLAKVLAIIFDGKFISHKTLEDNLTNNKKTFGFNRVGENLTYRQDFGVGINYLAWDLKDNKGIVVLSNYADNTNTIGKLTDTLNTSFLNE